MSQTTAAPTARLPRQIPYIIGNEACERFSFYGMRNILVQFLVSSVILAYVPEAERQGVAKDVFHSFVIGVYFFPLLGGWLADRYFGKYNTVLWFSLVYCAGHACLALFEDSRNGFYTGLFLIALGSGGIKPLVVSFCGDQFTAANKHLAKLVFDGFYWTINFGSFFASLLMPLFLRNFGPAVAFGIPGVLMFLAMGLGLGAGRFDALYLAVACALSSTVIIVKVLYEKRELDTLPGRITLGVLVLQDIFAILFLAVQPSLDNLQISVILLSVARVAVLVTTAWVLSRYVLPKLFHQIARRPELVMLGALVMTLFTPEADPDPQDAASPIGYDQRSSPVRASRARSRASFQTYTVPSWTAGPASGASKSVWAPASSHSFCPVDASHAWTPPPRVPVTTVPRSAWSE